MWLLQTWRGIRRPECDGLFLKESLFVILWLLKIYTFVFKKIMDLVLDKKSNKCFGINESVLMIVCSKNGLNHIEKVSVTYFTSHNRWSKLNSSVKNITLSVTYIKLAYEIQILHSSELKL